ncbi:MAG TPA: Cys-tRNA(Pro) deacylase [Caulobacteraceae bacterium]|nr:Cys-tRNA(Pro) deacylase [Caulobacteraceae bacterium]
MSKHTPATLFLAKAGVPFTLRPYAYDPNAERIGLAAAEALGADPAAVLKTLMTRVDGQPVCVVVPSDREIQMKALAAAVGGKSAEMMKPADAERLTGYHVGGISPFGRKRPSPTVVEEDALLFDKVTINAGQRGLLVELDPADAVRVLEAVTAAVSG